MGNENQPTSVNLRVDFYWHIIKLYSSRITFYLIILLFKFFVNIFILRKENKNKKNKENFKNPSIVVEIVDGKTFLSEGAANTIQYNTIVAIDTVYPWFFIFDQFLDIYIYVFRVLLFMSLTVTAGDGYSDSPR
jgi:hypothetical protein